MTTIYIDVSEHRDVERAVLLAKDREGKKILFIGDSELGRETAHKLELDFDQLPAGSKVPCGEWRIFADMLVVAH